MQNFLKCFSVSPPPPRPPTSCVFLWSQKLTQQFHLIIVVNISLYQTIISRFWCYQKTINYLMEIIMLHSQQNWVEVNKLTKPQHSWYWIKKKLLISSKKTIVCYFEVHLNDLVTVIVLVWIALFWRTHIHLTVLYNSSISVWQIDRLSILVGGILRKKVENYADSEVLWY